MKDETNKNGWTKCVTIIRTMCQKVNAPSTHGIYSKCKVTWFCTCTQENDWQRINKRQEHKEEEEAATGIIIARIC